jgi:acylphosphatase
VKLKLKISGPKVHDVGYRAFLLETAEDAGLRGFQARNVAEEGLQVVMVCLEGEEIPMAEFRRIIEEQRPAKSEVSLLTFEEFDGPVEEIQVFAGRFQARQLRKGISSIIRIEDKQDQMINLQVKMLDKQDQMLQLQSKTIDKLDETRKSIIGKLDETRGAIVDKLDETRESIVGKLDENREATVKEIRGSSEAVVQELRSSQESTGGGSRVFPGREAQPHGDGYRSA